MCTLVLSDMGELHDEWLREPAPRPAAGPPVDRVFDAKARTPATVIPALPTAAALAIAYLTEAPVAARQ